MELISPPFYTSQFGYKLQASLFLNGNGTGENSHVSIYIKILPGDYDALLRWPFAHSVAFTLFDQSEKVSLHGLKVNFFTVGMHKYLVIGIFHPPNSQSFKNTEMTRVCDRNSRFCNGNWMEENDLEIG